MMRFFANLFLVLFFIDGGISVVDELLSVLALGHPLAMARNLVANLVVLLAVPMYLSLGIDRRLPKAVFLPLTIFVLLCPFSSGFYPAVSATKAFGLITACMQLTFILLPLYHNRMQEGRKILMPREMFRQPFFSGKNTLIFGAVNLFVIPVALVVFGLATVNAYLYRNTAGFMRIGPGGLYMTEKVYRRADKTVRLVSMIHIGKKEYYDDLVRSIPSERTIVLAEGVTDEKNLLSNRFGYGRMAGYLGLTSQEKMRFKGRFIETEDMEGPTDDAVKGRKPDIVRADVDVASFRPTTVHLLDVLGKYLTSSDSFADGVIGFCAWSRTNVTPATNEAFMDDILYRRNRELIRHLGKAIPRYDTIVIPWGALHLPGIEEAVRARGFALQEEREVESINFARLLGASGPGTHENSREKKQMGETR